ncbi:hypothetical protein PS627_00215 [Pseudomonas fluorescens]|uniref:dermonecrotic toxin domain-containing protein n=1 Tax=Pseudomonas fluorescens TaxID=294 RepID=UPI001255E775|nr:DUF6543 domain-containing protein [Pseudomonas fluorescens]CAG8863279.1 hypothetical protein PS627_00215 [Pseudomonas fluorescens]
MSSPDTENPHHHLIQMGLPAWAKHATPEHWQDLRRSHLPLQGLPGAEADWFANAAPDLRDAVLASQLRLQRSQQALARSLRGLQQIAEFCEPLLKQALLQQHGFTAQLADSELLRVKRTWQWQGNVYLNTHERQRLLQAALQNFEDGATFEEHSAIALHTDISVQPVRVKGTVFVSPDLPGAPIVLQSEAYQVTPLPLDPAAFAITCRELDLGQRYQAHLQHLFESPINQAKVREQAIAVHRDRLRVAADLGFLRHHLSGAATDVVQALLEDQTRQCWQVSLFDIRLHDVLIIDAGHAGLLLYLPDQASALRQFANLAALTETLARDLLDEAWRTSFTAFVPLDRRTEFNRVLQQNLGGDLHLQRVSIEPGVFDVLQDDYLARLKGEARILAVPTAEADEQARTRRQAHWEHLGMDVLTLAGFFIPAVGALLLAVTAYQLMDEVYEGYQAWSIGDRELALRHCEAVGLNLALIGGLYLAGKALPTLLSSPLMESLDPVRLENASRRLWRADLAPYRSTRQLPADLAPDAAGRYLHEERYFIRMEGELYEQRLDTATGQWRVVHPQDPQAYQPALEHNGEGAWRGAHEQPQDWTYATLVRRLGTIVGEHDDAELEIAAQISGIDKARLQHIHLSNQPAPLLLRDTLDRLAANREAALAPAYRREEVFNRAYEGASAADPAVNRLRARYPRLSHSLASRFIDRLSAADLLAWDADHSLPPSLEAEVQILHGDLPMARAMEGLYLPTLANSDSERLVLACLERLPGWPAQLRLELRGASPQGPLLAKAGMGPAQSLRTVLKTPGGYEPHLGDRPAPAPEDPDLCRAILRALSSNERRALSLADEDAAALRVRLQQLAGESRGSLVKRLWGRKRSQAPGLSLRGGAPTDYPVSNLRSSFISRYRRLYPRAGDAEIEQVLRNWRRQLRAPEQELQRLEDRLRGLREHLALWSHGNARRLPAVQPLIDALRFNNVMALADGTQIQSLTLRDLRLETADLAELELPDAFDHVQVLNLGDNRHLDLLPPSFIQRFPGVRYLHLHNCRFDRLPSVLHPERAVWLDLQGNRVTWDANAQDALERFTHLRVLDLSENPLLQAPDLSQAQHLHSVFLSDCSLTELPRGLERMVAPTVLDLSDNQFVSLPDDLNLTLETGQAMRLESPWLSARVHNQIAAYHESQGVDLLVADTDYEELLDLADDDQWEIWMRLPLQYRRDLRAVIESDAYLNHLDQAHDQLWQRLRQMDTDPGFRARALAQPAERLLELAL